MSGPTRTRSGEGYFYYRDRRGGVDVTIYEHQLIALHKYSLAEILDPQLEVHHKNHLKFDNRIENLVLELADEHGRYHRQQQIAADGGTDAR